MKHDQVAAKVVCEQVVDELCESFTKQETRMKAKLEAKDKQLEAMQLRLEEGTIGTALFLSFKLFS